MKATELIAKLQALVDEFDDYEVTLGDGHHYAETEEPFYAADHDYEDGAWPPVFMLEPKRGATPKPY